MFVYAEYLFACFSFSILNAGERNRCFNALPDKNKLTEIDNVVVEC